MVEHDLFDFLLLSSPTTTGARTRTAPEAQVRSLAEADRQPQRVMDAAGA
jgi:hypothetical protein